MKGMHTDSVALGISLAGLASSAIHQRYEIAAMWLLVVVLTVRLLTRSTGETP